MHGSAIETRRDAAATSTGLTGVFLLVTPINPAYCPNHCGLQSRLWIYSQGGRKVHVGCPACIETDVDA